MEQLNSEANTRLAARATAGVGARFLEELSVRCVKSPRVFENPAWTAGSINSYLMWTSIPFSTTPGPS